MSHNRTDQWQMSQFIMAMAPEGWFESLLETPSAVNKFMKHAETSVYIDRCYWHSALDSKVES